MSFLRRGATAVACALLAACGGGEGGLGPSASVQVDPTSLTIPQQQSQQLTVSVLDGDGALLAGVPVTFASSDTNLVTVSPTGLVRSVGPAGQATVVVKAKGVTKSAAVPVTVTATSDHIVVTPNPGAVPQKGTLQLDAQLVDRVGQPIPGAVLGFSSSDPNILSVSPTGLVTSAGPAGQATIFITTGELTAQTVIAVTQVPTTLVVRPAPILLGTGQQLRISASVLDAVGTPMPGQAFGYTATPTGIITVDGTGLLSSVGPIGNGTLSVTSGTLRTDVAVSVVSAAHPTNMAISAHVELASPAFAAVVSASAKVYVVGLYGTLAYGTLASNALTSTSLGSQLTALVANAAGDRLWVGNAPAGGLTEFDVSGETPGALGTVTGLVGTVFDVKLSPDGQRVYASTSDGKVYVVDAATRTVTNTFDIGGGIVHLVRHPSQPLLYASAPNEVKVVEIDLQTQAVRTLLSSGARPQALALSPDASELYVADETGAVKVITLATGATQSIGLGCGAYGMVMTPDGMQLYVTCPMYGAGEVKVVDRATRAVVGTIQTNGTPRRPGVSPDGFTVVVPNEQGWVDYIR
ncbi:MAG TPA: Ig-like domain-containing protein [Gemmatimonadales bacterium]|nr:Ig-like domain-containing protein [Gemmatimonadales bacterium]